MKKHQLLEKAMRDYPAGTVLTWGGTPEASTGVFLFEDVGAYKGGIVFYKKHFSDLEEPRFIVFDGKTWADVLPKQPIDVKLFFKDHHALIFKDQIEINNPDVSIVLKPSDLEDMLQAYRSIL